MPVFTLADPRNGRVFYVGEAKSLHTAVGSILIRTAGPLHGLLKSIEAEELLPVLRTYDMQTKEELLAKHVRTVLNTGRKGPESTKVTMAAIEYNNKLLARLHRKGLPTAGLGQELMRRGLVWARRQKL